jgi:hypothetical protein
MPDSTRDSDRIFAEARQSLAVQREGGFHRRKGSLSIGQGSAEIKAKHLAGKLVKIAIGVVGVLVAASVVGAIIDGIQFWGMMITALAIAAVVGVVATRKVKVPQLKDINRGDVRQMVGRTELWLEHQRPMLPPPAVQVVDQLGAQLDALGQQLQGVDQAHPAVVEVRKLVGEHLPETIETYRKIPAHLRREERAGSTPDQQITDSLGKISKEIDSVTRQLAEGSLDDLAIKTRYLEYRYNDGEMEGGNG